MYAPAASAEGLPSGWWGGEKSTGERPRISARSHPRRWQTSRLHSRKTSVIRNCPSGASSKSVRKTEPSAKRSCAAVRRITSLVIAPMMRLSVVHTTECRIHTQTGESNRSHSLVCLGSMRQAFQGKHRLLSALPVCAFGHCLRQFFRRGAGGLTLDGHRITSPSASSTRSTRNSHPHTIAPSSWMTWRAFRGRYAIWRGWTSGSPPHH